MTFLSIASYIVIFLISTLRIYNLEEKLSKYMMVIFSSIILGIQFNVTPELLNSELFGILMIPFIAIGRQLSISKTPSNILMSSLMLSLFIVQNIFNSWVFLILAILEIMQILDFINKDRISNTIQKISLVKMLKVFGFILMFVLSYINDKNLNTFLLIPTIITTFIYNFISEIKWINEKNYGSAYWNFQNYALIPLVLSFKLNEIMFELNYLYIIPIKACMLIGLVLISARMIIKKIKNNKVEYSNLVVGIMPVFALYIIDSTLDYRLLTSLVVIALILKQLIEQVESRIIQKSLFHIMMGSPLSPITIYYVIKLMKMDAENWMKAFYIVLLSLSWLSLKLSVSIEKNQSELATKIYLSCFTILTGIYIYAKI